MDNKRIDNLDYIIIEGIGYNNTREINRVPAKDIKLNSDGYTIGDLLKAFNQTQVDITTLQDENAKLKEKQAVIIQKQQEVYLWLEILCNRLSIINIDTSDLTNTLNELMKNKE